MREDWVESTLGEVCFTTSGGTPSRGNKSFYGGNIPWVKSGELNNNLITETSEYITEEAIVKSSAKLFPKGTILFALYGATIGKMAVLDIDASSNQAVCGIYENRKIIHSQYLYNYLFYQKRNLIEQGIGGAQPNISQTILKKLSVPIAPLPIQRAIVAKIEELFSSLDSGIADLKKAQEQLIIYRQGLLKKAFEGEWKKENLEKVSIAMGGFAFKSGDFLSKGKFQVIRIGNVRPGSIRKKKSPVFLNEIDIKVKEKYLLKANDIVITLTGTRKKRDYGYTSIITETNQLLNQRLAYIRFQDNLLPKFFLYYSWSEPFKEQFFGSETGNVGQGNVGMTSVRKTLVPIPSIEEQKRIIEELESKFLICDKVEEDLKRGLASSEALRQSILKKAFDGKLLSEQELEKCKKENDYEPANILLQKIKNRK